MLLPLPQPCFLNPKNNNNYYHSLYCFLNFDWLIYLQIIVWACAFVKKRFSATDDTLSMRIGFNLVNNGLRLRQIIDLLATDKSRYFARPRPIIDYCWRLCRIWRFGAQEHWGRELLTQTQTARNTQEPPYLQPSHEPRLSEKACPSPAPAPITLNWKNSGKTYWLNNKTM